jgi:hypothetical protein
VNCVVPIRIRLVGRPTDQDLVRLEEVVARLVARQLLAAQRTLHGGGQVVPPAGGGAGTATRPPLVQGFATGPQPVDPFDPFKKHLQAEAREAMRRTPPTIPGDLAQQWELFSVPVMALWDRPDIQSRMVQLAEQVEASDPGNAKHTKTAMLDGWKERFRLSVQYILTERETERDPVPVRKLPGKAPEYRSVPAQMKFQIALGLEEAKLLKSSQGDTLVAEVEALRARYKQEWGERVEKAAQRFVVLAENEAELIISGEARRKPEFVLGLPQGLEKEVTWQQAPDQLEARAAPVAASVVSFWKAVQEEVGQKHKTDKAENYGAHEKWSPHFTDRSIGKYSFDVHPSVNIVPQTGFYNRAELIEYFKAVEKASQKTGIDWVAFYNDAAVIREFNDFVKKRRLAFSGGGGGGTYHHGPAPYILHIHVNIMPRDLAAVYLVGERLIKAREVFQSWWAAFGAH